MKIVSADIMSNEKHKQLIHREAMLIRLLDHPNIISVNNYFMTKNGEFCSLMEYRDSYNLQ